MAVTQTTTRVIKFTAASDAYTGSGFAKAFVWSGTDIAAGDDIKITDTAGTILWELVADVADAYKEISFADRPLPFTGIIVATLDHGSFYLYLD